MDIGAPFKNLRLHLEVLPPPVKLDRICAGDIRLSQWMREKFGYQLQRAELNTWYEARRTDPTCKVIHKSGPEFDRTSPQD